MSITSFPITDFSKQLDRKQVSHCAVLSPRFFRNSVWTRSGLAGALPYSRCLVALVSSSIEKGCGRSLLDGVFVTSCLISDLTERGCFLALGLRFNHLPLFTRIVAMDLAETGQGLGVELFPVRRLMVDQALRLESVKSILVTSSSNLARLFWPRVTSSSLPTASFSVSFLGVVALIVKCLAFLIPVWYVGGNVSLLGWFAW